MKATKLHLAKARSKDKAGEKFNLIRAINTVGPEKRNVLIDWNPESMWSLHKKHNT